MSDERTYRIAYLQGDCETLGFGLLTEQIS